MAEVYHRPRGGKGSDPPTAHRALRRFLKAAYALDKAWHPVLDVPTYPRYLPAFHEFAQDLADWREEVKGRPSTEPRPITPVNLTDPDAVRAWLAELRRQLSDATGAGKDALRRRRRRRLGPFIARTTFREACHAIEQLLTAAECCTANAASG